VGLLKQSQSLNAQLEQEVQASVARPFRELLEVDCRKAKASVKKTQEQRLAYQEVIANMERERKKGKVTVLDSENQIKRAAAEYAIAEADCKKAVQLATSLSTTTTVMSTASYLKVQLLAACCCCALLCSAQLGCANQAYLTFWENGAKMKDVFDATVTKNVKVGSDMQERLKKEDSRSYKVFGWGLLIDELTQHAQTPHTTTTKTKQQQPNTSLPKQPT
jgi:hypothetical protein